MVQEYETIDRLRDRIFSEYRRGSVTVLKTKIKISQSKKAWTQYITIPSAVVQDSQYPFKANDELLLEIEPTIGIMIISREDRPMKVTPNGVLVMQKLKNLTNDFEVGMNSLVKRENNE